MAASVESEQKQGLPVVGRVSSVDFFRGLTMFLLIGESTRLYSYLLNIDNGFVHLLATQLNHHEWHGLHFWDLIQPFFMFIVGVAIPFSVHNRKKRGDSDGKLLKHAIKRSLVLLALGLIVYNITSDHIVLRLQNVLAQLSITYLVAFLIQRKSFSFQVVFTLIILLLADLAYRFFPVEGFNHPWEAYHNLGTWVNIKIEGSEQTSIWASLNAIPTIAHTVWGGLCGKLLISKRIDAQKFKIMIVAGIACFIVGYSLDFLNITPIIKKIATSSFVFVSGGWSILVLCFSYWLIDVKKRFVKGAKMFIAVGMNCIFIYMIFECGGTGFLSDVFMPIFNSLLFRIGGLTFKILISISVWVVLWYVCHWMFKNKIFIKI